MMKFFVGAECREVRQANAGVIDHSNYGNMESCKWYIQADQDKRVYIEVSVQ